MAILPILTGNHPVLRQHAKKVGRVDKQILRLLDDMTETVKAAPGIGLAANQVGRLVRVIVVWYDDQLHQLINPEILRTEGDIEMEEGCLSLPGIWGEVRRPERVLVRALTRNGKITRLNAGGMLARILQHEIDHLDGVLFIDRVASADKIHYKDADEDKPTTAKIAKELVAPHLLSEGA